MNDSEQEFLKAVDGELPPKFEKAKCTPFYPERFGLGIIPIKWITRKEFEERYPK